MTIMKPETRIVNKIKSLENKYKPNLIIEKNWGGPMSGVGRSDLSVIYNSIYYKIEVKTPDKEPSPSQQAYLEKWSRAGAITGCVHSVEEFIKLVGLPALE